MATKEQLRKLRQKYGLGEYKKKGRSKPARRVRRIKRRKTITGVRTMAKRRAYSRRKKTGYMAQARGLAPTLLGVGGYIAYEAIISPRIPMNQNTRNIAELVAGALLMRKPGVVGHIARTAVIINSYQLMRAYSPFGKSSTGSGISTASQIIY